MSVETWSYWGKAAPGSRPPGDGWSISGYEEKRTPNSRMGSGYSVTKVPIWIRTAQAAQPAPAPAAPPTPTPVAQAQSVINATINRPVASYPAPAAPAQPDPMAGLRDAMNAQAAQAEQQMAALQQLMIQQQSQYQAQMAVAQGQQAAAMAQATESARQAEALQRAFVPNLEPTATAPSLGDAREGSGTRTAAANTLSNLAILTGINGAASAGVGATSSLAGLQIA